MTAAPVAHYGRYAYQSVRNGTRQTLELEKLLSRTHDPPDAWQTIRNWVGSRLAPVPHIFVDIKFEHFETLRRKRDEALRSAFLFRSEGDQVPATIRHNGKRVKVKVRLKGDFLGHLESRKWSLRVETKNGQELFGLRRFSLQAPHTRYYHFEPLLLDHTRREGILSVRTRFVDVTLNGNHLGLMNLEEHFSKELLEGQGRPEGVIVGYDDTDYWRSYQRRRMAREELRARGILYDLPKAFNSWKIARVRPFRPKKVAQSPLLSRHADLAAAMLRGVASETITPADVFDVDLTGKFLAICDLWGTWHPLAFYNVRFYLNPVTLKLEPIAFDTNVSKNWYRKGHSYRSSGLYHFLIMDPSIRESYFRHMGRFVQPEYLDELEVRVAELEAELLRVLHRDFPDLPRFDFSSIRRKAELRRPPNRMKLAELKPFREDRAPFDEEHPPYSSAVYAYLIEESGGYALELLNPLRKPVVVDEIWVRTEDGVVPASAFTDLELPLTLPPNDHGLTPRYSTPPVRSLEWRLTRDFDPASMSVSGVAHIEGQKLTYEFSAGRYVAPLGQSPFVHSGEVERLLSRFPFLEWVGDSFRTRPGVWEVAEPIRIPPRISAPGAGRSRFPVRNPGLTVVAGTTLDFGERSYLRLSGPLHLRGQPQAPVVLRGRDGATWKGLLVAKSPERSVWSHAAVYATAHTREGPWQLTGGVTFFESDVTMTDVEFRRATSEDALNIIRSSFDLRGVSVVDTASDAIDSDFSSGTLTDGRLENIGGDAIDLSGSDVRVSRAAFRNVRDKALSAGEASRLTASGVEAHDVGAAIASKDGSHAVLSNARLRDVRHIALMAYNKKPEYGRASLVASALDYDGSARLQAVQRGHLLTIDGKRMYTQRIDVEALYETGFMRK